MHSALCIIINTRVWRNWAKRNAASGRRYRHCAEVKKQGAMRSAPSEQGDYVFEGNARGAAAFKILKIILHYALCILHYYKYAGVAELGEAECRVRWTIQALR